MLNLNIQNKMEKETLEEAAESRFGTDMDSIRGSSVYDLNTDLKRGFIKGAKWQSERMYSDMQEYAEFCIECDRANLKPIIAKDWFEQFKKK